MERTSDIPSPNHYPACVLSQAFQGLVSNFPELPRGTGREHDPPGVFCSTFLDRLIGMSSSRILNSVGRGCVCFVEACPEPSLHELLMETNDKTQDHRAEISLYLFVSWTVLECLLDGMENVSTSSHSVPGGGVGRGPKEGCRRRRWHGQGPTASAGPSVYSCHIKAPVG